MTDKEAGLEFNQKMDAVSVQGVWLPFPSVAVQTGRGHVAAGILRSLIESESKEHRKGKRRETKKDRVSRLMKQVEVKMIEMDNDEEVVMLFVVKK